MNSEIQIYVEIQSDSHIETWKFKNPKISRNYANFSDSQILKSGNFNAQKYLEIMPNADSLKY